MPEKRIPVARPWMGEAEASAAKRVILSGWVTQGPEVAAFEEEFAALVGSAHACATSSCTAALHLALRAVGVEPGDEVIVPSYSFIATANAIRYCDAVPVFVDIEQSGLNIDADLVEQSIGSKTKAILCVHQMGMPCDVRRLAAIAAKHGLPVIEDAACAIGSEIRNSTGQFELVGRPHGDIACFSFHPRKILTTGEGGMITTRDADLDARVRRERQQGVDVSPLARHDAKTVIDDAHTSLGYNYRMTDVQAAIGRVQLTRLAGILERRRVLADRYRDLLKDLPVTLPSVPDDVRPNWQSFWIELPADCERHELMETMLDAGVSTRRGVHCAHREPAYATEPWMMGAGDLARSERAQDRSLVLPLFHQMTESDQDQVMSVLDHALATAGKGMR
jgi:perosamine synthetase